MFDAAAERKRIGEMIAEYKRMPLNTYDNPNIDKRDLYLKIEHAMRMYDLRCA